MAAKGCVLPRAQVRRMMETARATTEAMRLANIAGYERRRTDPIERAKLALQRARVVCFSHSLHVPGSTLIVVGSQKMTPEAMIAYAEQHGRW